MSLFPLVSEHHRQFFDIYVICSLPFWFFAIFYVFYVRGGGVSNAHFTTTCDESDSLCKCADYLSFTEPPYEDNSTVKTWCGKAPFVFRSRGRFVAVNYLYESGFNNPFNLTYVAKST